MRRALLLVLSVVALVAMTAAPVVAGQGAEKTTYYAVECFAEPQFTAPPKIADGTIHVRGAIGFAEEWLWDGSGWAQAGENHTVINFNGKLGPSGPEDLRLWGTFEIDLSLAEIGVFEGSWASGRASGKSDDGRLIKADLSPPAFPEELMPLPDCGAADTFPAVYTVIDPGK